jgi:hypothetical protein
MIILFFISLVAFISGIIATVLKYGIPASISESYYLLPDRASLPVFYGCTVFVTIPLAIFWLNISGGTAQTLVFFGCVFLIFVGVAAPFRDKGITNKIHVISAALCALLTQIWIFIYTPFWCFSLALAGLFAAFGYAVNGLTGNKSFPIYTNSLIFFLELAAFISVYFAVYGFYKLQT